MSEKIESNLPGNLIRSYWSVGDHYGNVQNIRIEVFVPAKVTTNSIKNLHPGFCWCLQKPNNEPLNW